MPEVPQQESWVIWDLLEASIWRPPGRLETTKRREVTSGSTSKDELLPSQKYPLLNGNLPVASAAGIQGTRRCLPAPCKGGRRQLSVLAAAQLVETDPSFAQLQNGSDIRGTSIEGWSLSKAVPPDYLGLTSALTSFRRRPTNIEMWRVPWVKGGFGYKYRQRAQSSKLTH